MRQQVLSAIEHWIGSAAPVLAFMGPDGVGKTSVLARVTAIAGERYPVVTLSATASAATVPLAVIADELAYGSMAHQLHPGVFASHLRQQAGGRQVLLAVDQADLLDDHSAAVVHFAVRHDHARAVLTLTSVTRAPDAIRRLLRDSDARLVRLTPLGDDEVGSWLRHQLAERSGHHDVLVDPRTVRWLARACRGLPAVMHEMIECAVSSGDLVEINGVWRLRKPFLPHSVRAPIVEGLDALPAAVRVVADLVGLAGSVPLAGLDALVPENVLLEAESLDVIEVVPGRPPEVRLRDPLAGDVIRAGMGQLRRRHLARLLAGLFASDRCPDAVRSALWQLRGDMPVEPLALLAGARTAAARQDHRLTAELAGAAAARGLTDASLVNAEAMAWQGRVERAVQDLAILDGAGDVDRAAVARVHATVLALGLGRFDEARHVLSHVEGLTTDPTSRAVLTAVRAVVELVEGDVRVALTQVAAMSDPTVDAQAKLHLLPSVVTALSWSGRACLAAQVGSRVLSQVQTVGDRLPYLVDVAAATVCFARLYGGDLAGGLDQARLSYQRAAEAGSPDQRATWAYALGYGELQAGRPRVAVALLREAAALFAEHFTLFGGRGYANCVGALIQAQTRTGNRTGAEAALERLAARAHPEFQPHLEVGLVWLDAARGEPAAAVARALAAAADCDARGCATYALQAVHAAACVSRTVGPELAAGCDRARRLAAAADDPMSRLYAAHVEAVVRADAGALEDVADRFADLGALLPAIDAAVAAHGLWAKGGRRDASVRAATRARELMRRAGPDAGWHVSALTDQAALTARESELVGLTVAGLGNRDIAKRLTLSVRTVENHLHRAFAKLGVTGREQLTEIFREPGAECDRAGLEW